MKGVKVILVFFIVTIFFVPHYSADVSGQAKDEVSRLIDDL